MSWTTIRTARDLKRTLLAWAKGLEKQGQTQLATEWRTRIADMPAQMDKEAINTVLLAASFEAQKLKIQLEA